jgi:putative serine protease PepD
VSMRPSGSGEPSEGGAHPADEPAAPSGSDPGEPAADRSTEAGDGERGASHASTRDASDETEGTRPIWEPGPPGMPAPSEPTQPLHPFAGSPAGGPSPSGGAPRGSSYPSDAYPSYPPPGGAHPGSSFPSDAYPNYPYPSGADPNDPYRGGAVPSGPRLNGPPLGGQPPGGLPPGGAYGNLPYPGDPYGGPPPPRRSRSLLWPVAVIALLLGLAGGAVGGALSRDDQGTATSGGDSVPVQPVITSSGPVAGGSRQSPVIGVADKVLPSVVSIDVQGEQEEVTGSGFVYDSRGRVITNNHVIAAAGSGGEIHVTLADGSEHRAEVVGRSPAYDVAVIRVDDPSHLVPATLGSSAGIRVGQTVVAIGSPLGLNATVTSGIISAIDRPVTAGGEGEASFIDALQTDAAINPGNSGGPLVDLDGFVIGVNSAIATLGGSSAQQSGSIGVGFSIPIDQVSRTVRQIIATGHAEYPIIGAEVSVAPGFGGAKVTTVTTGSPADRAGIQTDDVIKQIDGVTVDDGVELIVGIRTYEPGDTVTLSVVHDGEARDVHVVLGKHVG